MELSSRISKKRSTIMGLAIIFILALHSFNNYHMGYMQTIAQWGYWGVDIFLFVSGFGCYLSLYKNQGILNFYKKRISKIFPIYLPIAIVYVIFLGFLNNTRLSEIIRSLLINCTGIGIILPLNNSYPFNWYIPMILSCYLLTPIIKLFFDWCAQKNRIRIGIVILCLLLYGIYFFSVFTEIGENYLIYILRYGAYFVGMGFGAVYVSKSFDFSGYKEKYLDICKITITIFLLGISVTVFEEYSKSKGLIWFPSAFFIIPLIRVLTAFSEKLDSLDRSNLLKKLGGGHWRYIS